MALLFAAGAAFFLVGPFPGYAGAVGARAVGVTFFAGSIMFTAGGALPVWLPAPARAPPGGALQVWRASPDRTSRGAGRSGWWAAVVQSAGTLFFNVSTYHALHTA